MSKGYKVDILTGDLYEAESGTLVAQDERDPLWEEYQKWLQEGGEVFYEEMPGEDPGEGGEDPGEGDGKYEGHFVEERARTSTTSTKWRKKLELEVQPLFSGEYLLSWHYCWGHSSPSSSFFAEVRDSEGAVLFSHEESSRQGVKTQRVPVSGFCRVRLKEGAAVKFLLLYRSGSSEASAFIEQARLSASPVCFRPSL